MTLAYEYSTLVEFAPSVGQHNILLRCLPARTAFQQCRDEVFDLSENFWHEESMDGFGNRVITGGTNERHSCLRYTCRGVVDSSTYCMPEEHPHPMYGMQSQQTFVTRDMLTLQPRMTGVFLDDCMQITHAVHSYIIYTPRVTGMQTTAEDVYRMHKGVCQDYAHLMIALCRAAGLPARYVCGLMSGEGQTHAWVEVHDGCAWYAFDPTNDSAIASGFIKLAHGRDALDCPVSRGMYMGCADEKTWVNVKVLNINV